MQPDSVIISGPAAIVDTIDVVQTIPEKIKKIDKSFSEELKLQPIEKVYLVKKKIRVIVPVEKYTESNLQIPIRCINIPDSLHIKTFPNSLKVDVLISLRNYNKLTPQNFSAVVDFKSINNNINNKLKVKILRQPAYVRIIGFSPRNVEYLIEK